MTQNTIESNKIKISLSRDESIFLSENFRNVVKGLRKSDYRKHFPRAYESLKRIEAKLKTRSEILELTLQQTDVFRGFLEGCFEQTKLEMFQSINKKFKLPVIVEVSNEPGCYTFFCEGCNMHHQVWTQTPGKPQWSFNGDLEKPTFSPSLLVRYPQWDGEKQVEKVCHSFIKDGLIQYLGDCTHKFANMTIPIKPVDNIQDDEA